jgi:hypothetical protein
MEGSLTVSRPDDHIAGPKRPNDKYALKRELNERGGVDLWRSAFDEYTSSPD